MKAKIEPGGSISSITLKEMMREVYVGNGIFANPENPSLTDILPGIVTSGPNREFLEKKMEHRTGVELLSKREGTYSAQYRLFTG
jgi:hypothetical protein